MHIKRYAALLAAGLLAVSPCVSMTALAADTSAVEALMAEDSVMEDASQVPLYGNLDNGVLHSVFVPDISGTYKVYLSSGQYMFADSAASALSGLVPLATGTCQADETICIDKDGIDMSSFNSLYAVYLYVVVESNDQTQQHISRAEMLGQDNVYLSGHLMQAKAGTAGNNAFLRLCDFVAGDTTSTFQMISSVDGTAYVFPYASFATSDDIGAYPTTSLSTIISQIVANPSGTQSVKVKAGTPETVAVDNTGFGKYIVSVVVVPNDSSYVYTAAQMGVCSTVASAVPQPVEEKKPEVKSQPQPAPHTHSMHWEMVTPATEDKDGLMQYRCDCGYSEYSYTLPAFGVFNDDTVKAIKNAKDGATVKRNATKKGWISYTPAVISALDHAKNVKLVTDFTYKSQKYELTLSSEADYSSLGDLSKMNAGKCFGYMYLAKFGTLKTVK